MLKTRTTCRLCGSSALAPILSLGAQRLAGQFAMRGDIAPVTRALPLELVRCDPGADERACGLVQLRHTVPGDLMYTAYGYRSGINETMVRHLAGIAQQAEARVALRDRDVVVDVGANDGTLLRHYRAEGPRYVGFEPSLVPLGEAGRPVELIRDYFGAPAYRRAVGARQAALVTSIAMFYDLEDPCAFARDVAAILADDGVWVLEVQYLLAMLDDSSFDTICHEHLAYHALSTLERAVTAAGLIVIDAELNRSNGGSIRVTAAHPGSRPAGQRDDGARARLYQLRKREIELELESAAPYTAFAARVEAIRHELPQLLRQLAADGKRVWGYGASTKGNVILQSCGIGPDLLHAIADRNPDKVGGATVGTGIPIVSEESMRAAEPDLLLVLPWHFLDGFRDRERSFVARGGRFIVPFPQVRVVS